MRGWALGAALGCAAAAGTSGCTGGGSPGSAGDAATASGDAAAVDRSVRALDGAAAGWNCTDIQLCSNACKGDPDCNVGCVAGGSDEGRAAYTAIDGCLEKECGAACGGGNSGSPACHACQCKTQCTPDGACRLADEACVGASPDPGCKTSCG